MTNEQSILLSLIRTAVCNVGEELGRYDEATLVSLSLEQGVAPLVMAAAQWYNDHLGVKIFGTENVLQLYAAAENLKKTMQQKKQVSMEFAEKLGMQCVVLKGLDYCRFWPKEEWRGFGDFDIWPMANSYEQLNAKARELGCKVEDDGYYKHSEIRYKGLMVENHQCLTMHDDTRSGKIVESALRELIQEVSSFKFQVSSNLYSPSPTFTALFILAHAHEHFFWEGFSLKIVMDWLFFLRSKEASKVDWQKVEKVLEEAGMKGFMEVMTAFCERQLGLVQSCSSAIAVQDGSKLLDEFTEVVFEEGVEGCKAKQLLHRFHRMWRFRQFLGASILVRIKNTLVFNFLNKQPTLE